MTVPHGKIPVIQYGEGLLNHLAYMRHGNDEAIPLKKHPHTFFSAGKHIVAGNLIQMLLGIQYTIGIDSYVIASLFPVHHAEIVTNRLPVLLCDVERAVGTDNHFTAFQIRLHHLRQRIGLGCIVKSETVKHHILIGVKQAKSHDGFCQDGGVLPFDCHIPQSHQGKGIAPLSEIINLVRLKVQNATISRRPQRLNRRRDRHRIIRYSVSYGAEILYIEILRMLRTHRFRGRPSLRCFA